jgi:hypothetical protein
MLGIKTPPVKPVKTVPTNRLPKTYYTLHSHPNNAFTMKINEKQNTAIVGFKDIDDAILIGRMIETYYWREKELPDMTQIGALILPSPDIGDVLNHLYIQKWEFEELQLHCTRNILNLLSVQSFNNTKTGYSLVGDVYSFEANDLDFYRARFDELLPY